jgi:GNAT superfamily N-acetyltransferase
MTLFLTIETAREEPSQIRARLGAPGNPLLFPPHFLESALPKIGGHTLTVKRNDESVAYAFLFPRGLRAYTVRWHPVSEIEEGQILPPVARLFPDADLTFYDTRDPQPYEKGFRYGRPDAAEAVAARDLQRAIWKPANDDGLYPADLYSTSFGAATALVARAGEDVVGFLFGFYKIADGLRIESQVAGVDPRYQGKNIGFHLKKLQGDQARREGIEIVNWTVDPLQLNNARLNFKKLRAVSFRFLPGHYSLKSDQNRTRASGWRSPGFSLGRAIPERLWIWRRCRRWRSSTTGRARSLSIRRRRGSRSRSRRIGRRFRKRIFQKRSGGATGRMKSWRGGSGPGRGGSRSRTWG